MIEGDNKLQIVGLGMSTIDVLVRLEQMPCWESGASLDEMTLDGGGPAGTAIASAAHLGAITGMITTAGNDEVGNLKLRLLSKYGVDTSHCLIRPIPEPQVILVCIHSHSGERVFSGTPRTASLPLQPLEIDINYITQADILHLDGFYLTAALQAARWMRAAGKKVTLDAAKTSGNISGEMRELVSLCDIVISGAGFSYALTGMTDLYEAGLAILDLGPNIFVETLGEAGCVTVTRDDRFHTPAYPIDVLDTTGAGDVFHGAFLVGLLKSWDLGRIIQFSSATAAIKCSRLGGRRGIPDYDKVIKFLAEFQPDFKE